MRHPSVRQLIAQRTDAGYTGVVSQSHRARERVMSEQALMEIMARAGRNPAFWEQIKRDPTTALAGYALTAAERATVVRGSVEPLPALGLDTRVAKLAEDPTIPGEEQPGSL